MAPVSEARRSKFLEVLSQTGSMVAASSAATPWSTGKRCGWESFRDVMKRDIGFTAQVEEARSRALGLVEQTISDRAIHGWKRPVFQKGMKVGEETCFDNNLLLRLAVKLDPAWREKQGLDFDGTMRTLGGVLTITPEQILAMPDDLQAKVIQIIEAMAKKPT